MAIEPDHYSGDWDRLAKIAEEWDKIRALYGLAPQAKAVTIKPHMPAILRDDSPWPNVRWLRHQLEDDAGLYGHLETSFNDRLRPRERNGYTFQEVLPVVLLRLFWTVLRNAQTWIDTRRPGDEHWLRIRNTKNLNEELRRAIKDLGDGERHAEAAHPPAGPALPATFAGPSETQSTEPEIRGPDIPQLGYVQEPQRDYRGKCPETPEETLDFLEEICKGASDFAGKVFKDWWLSCEECTAEEEERIARRHGLTRVELNAIQRQFAW